MGFICGLECTDFKANVTFCFHALGAVTKMVLIVSISFLTSLRRFTLSKKRVTRNLFRLWWVCSQKLHLMHIVLRHFLNFFKFFEFWFYFYLSLYALPVHLINFCLWQEVSVSWLQLLLKFQSHTKHDLLNLAISELILVVRLNLWPLYSACYCWAMVHQPLWWSNKSSGHL